MAALSTRTSRIARLGVVMAGLLVALAACGGGGTPGGAGMATQSPPPDVPGPWHLVFNDHFTGSSLDTGNWATCYDWNDNGCTNGTNNEIEWYRPSQVSVGNGWLQLSAQRQATTGSDGHTYPWTSGMVTTGRDSWDATPRHTFTYGYFSAAIEIPAESGMFPAFWLLPAQHYARQEIDIAEFIGSTQQVQMTLHWQQPNGTPQFQRDSWGPVDFPAEIHVFAVDWEPGSVTWYVDGVERFRITDPAKVPTLPMELLLNLAVGYPSAPPDNVDHAVMKVDWVSVWQH
ncbi:glycoside hydrolase family 16 protein [Streptacidiphilus fuscans]|uniref:Glycoside hydrolase family 16 protein n=1 Tax=Streptacidiphilus fuscans TaxID=2789292 RepID=A0A931AXU3_9ACTN|nr:glycoside hydrolase family 16 protein [Streptacidiphilus fuscans]MBF9066538.1 glycoside hydrolase family 16 protein [Streptacidiphilus fuscans]